MTGTILIAPNEVYLEGPIVFLAGPIQGAPDWQKVAIEYIKSNAPNLHVASPRRGIKRDNEFTIEMYNEQVDWETKYLNRAAQNGAIMFWFAKETEHVCRRAYAQTSRLELGEWKIKHERDNVKLAVGIEEGFSGMRYITRRFSQDCPDIPIFSSLEETCKKAIELIYKN